MTLAQIGALIEGDRQFHDPKAKGSKRADPGTVMDLAMMSQMRVS